MKIHSSVTMNPDIDQAVKIVLKDIKSNLADIDYLLVFSTVEYDITELTAKLSRECGTIQFHGGTTCKGVMDPGGFHSESGRALGLWAISDPEGAYGVGYSELGSNPAQAASDAVSMALENADRSGEAPALIFMTTVPGSEEDAIKGIQDVVGSDVPITGGTCADNKIDGSWMQFTNGHVFKNAIIVTVLFPSMGVEVGVMFSSGYVPADKTGIVTKAKKRTIHEIDNEPAASVYNRWTNGTIQSVLGKGGSVLKTTTMFPLGREVGRLGNVPYFILSHPESVTTDGAVNLFTDINKGDSIELMTGSLDSLYTRAGRVARFLLDNEMQVNEITGALVFYCAGCMLAVDDKMGLVVKHLNENLNGAPFMGVFTFGEQGCFSNGENHHGNLMITVILFGRK